MTSMMDLRLAVEMVMTTTLVRTMMFTWRGPRSKERRRDERKGEEKRDRNGRGVEKIGEREEERKEEEEERRV